MSDPAPNQDPDGSPIPPGPEGATPVAATLTVFGSDPTPAQAWIIERPDRWRVAGALRRAFMGVVVAPVVFLVPPHVPWALGALAAGLTLAWRRLQERVTLAGLEGTCPRCGTPVKTDRPTRLKSPHTLPCEGCQHEMTLDVLFSPEPTP